MKPNANYVKVVSWSEDDQCFIGECSGVIGWCCHGDDEAQVHAELCRIVDEWIDILRKEGKPLPTPTAGKSL